MTCADIVIAYRQHPGQYDYFRNYDDLEMHFRKDHFLCEDDACLAKKFVVFQSDAEIKRHNAMEHGGRMSRAQRNAALQIPTSFIYQRNEQDQRRGRGRGRNAHHDRPDRDFSLPVRDGSATADHGLGSRVDSVAGPFQSLSVSSSSGRTETGRSLGNGRLLEQLSFPPLQDQDIPDARMDAVPYGTSFPPVSEQQSRYALALNQSSRGSARLGDESLFPPLPGSSNKGSASTQQGLQSLAKNTLASRLQQRSKGTVKVLYSAQSQTAENPEIVPHVSTSTQTWPTPEQGLHLSGSSQLWIVTQSTRENGLMPSASSGSAWNSRASNKMKHSISTPNFVSGGSSAQASSTAYGNKKQLPPQSSQPLPVVEDVRQANKSLVERMRVALGMDEDRFSAFKEIASEYRQGVIDTSEYLSYVEQFGISHLVPEMAKLLPDPLKQMELADAYYTNMRFRSLQENDGCGTITVKENKRRNKGKGKTPDAETAPAKDASESLADSFMDTVRKLQLNNKAQEGEAAVLSKDGYRSSKEKIPLSAGGSSCGTNMGLDGDPVAISKASGTSRYVGKGSSSSNNKQSKKTSKFLRARLGDNSLATLDFSHPDVSPERPVRETQVLQTGLPVRSVWKNGAAQKLFSSNGKK
ncbi:hypothetical protein CFC21_001483 [Triticum aestivum]|uniref:C2H2-type domain-containing protein n=1 Tax=Triticum aestivum TaxID=4565 RepID=A0A3B5XXR6_WHEAT|nr:hypothetical protein CFC21_001483 [Triticum aestivum]